MGPSPVTGVLVTRGKSGHGCSGRRPQEDKGGHGSRARTTQAAPGVAGSRGRLRSRRTDSPPEPSGRERSPAGTLTSDF